MPLLLFLEQMTGIEPAYSAWEADTLPLSYTCVAEHVYYNTKSVRCQDTERNFFKFIRKSFDSICQINII